MSIGRAKCRSDESTIPGASRVSMYAVPSPSGSSAICLLSIVVPLTPLLVLRSGDSATTDTVSFTPPASSVISTRSVSPTRTSCDGRTIFLNPESCAVTV